MVPEAGTLLINDIESRAWMLIRCVERHFHTSPTVLLRKVFVVISCMGFLGKFVSLFLSLFVDEWRMLESSMTRNHCAMRHMHISVCMHCMCTGNSIRLARRTARLRFVQLGSAPFHSFIQQNVAPPSLRQYIVCNISYSTFTRAHTHIYQVTSTHIRW